MPSMHVNKSVTTKDDAATHKAPHTSVANHQERTNMLMSAMQKAVPLDVRHRPYPEELVPLWSVEGFESLQRSVGPFEKVAENMEGQGPLQCGVTSLTVALNVCRASRRPRFTVHALQEMLRQALRPTNRFFSVSLQELGDLAKCFLSADVVHASDTTCDMFRHLATNTLEVGGCVIVNFKRAELGYNSPFGGHCSPLASYDHTTDEFLVMDVAQKSWQPVWVPTELLFSGMDTIEKPRDETIRGSLTRGFLLINPEGCAPLLRR